MDYIYIDESGDLGDKGSSYFVLAAIIVNNPKSLERLITKARRIYKKEIGKSNEIKGTTTPHKVKRNILLKLDKMDYEVILIVFNKKYKYKIDYGYDNHKLYDILASYLAQQLPISNTTEILIDRTKRYKDKINAFNNLFFENLKTNDYSVKINHVDSLNYKGIQIADLLSWSLYQYVEKNNDEYIKLIKNKSVYEIFED